MGDGDDGGLGGRLSQSFSGAALGAHEAAGGSPIVVGPPLLKEKRRVLVL